MIDANNGENNSDQHGHTNGHSPAKVWG
jgi:hypothetical protein